jgi:GTP-binding protein
MRFLDEVKIRVIAGKGGNGCMSFRREKFIPFGGPDGGNGGKGGDVVLVASHERHTLMDLRYRSIIRAPSGKHGSGSMLTGAAGEDEIIYVPVGTLIYVDETDELIVDLNENQQSFIIAKGGCSGFGNAHFKSSTNRAPRKSTKGGLGDEVHLRLELRLLADVGLLGLPNAGKSSLLRKLSSAKPKVADYPFTTLKPQLGVVDLGEQQSMVIADIPGLIEHAASGAGLGNQFLRHISRCDLLLHLVDATEDKDVINQKVLIEKELVAYDPGVYEKERWLILTKRDAISEATFNELSEGFSTFDKVFFISSITGQGIKDLLDAFRIYWKEKNYLDE